MNDDVVRDTRHESNTRYRCIRRLSLGPILNAVIPHPHAAGFGIYFAQVQRSHHETPCRDAVNKGLFNHEAIFAQGLIFEVPSNLVGGSDGFSIGPALVRLGGFIMHDAVRLVQS